MFNSDIETMPLAALRNLQNRRLQLMLNRIYTKVPFYNNSFNHLKCHPNDIKTIDDLQKLPFTYKDDLRNHYPFGLFAEPVQEVVRIHASSGTTGKPTVVGYTKNDLDVFDEVVARSLVCAGAKKGMKLHNAYGYGLFTGGLGLHGGATKLGMTVIPVSGGMTDRQITILKDFKPEVICCTPSYAQTLAESLKEKGIKNAELALKFAILGAEPWTESIRTQIETNLNVAATNIYGLSEIIGPGVAQEDWEERGSGSYIWEDHFFPEVVDKNTGKNLPYGEEGVLVLTTLTKEALPLLRYYTNDICSIYYDKNAKRTHIKMSAIKGRSDDMLIIRGVNLFYTQIEELIINFKELLPNYQVIISRKGTLDSLLVKIEVRNNSDIDNITLKEQLIHKIKDNIGLNMDISFIPLGSLPKSEGGKLQRVIDLRTA